MERKGGCCLAPRYAATAAAQQAGAAWQMGRIMLKFRPIAPKPAAMAPAPAPAPVTGPALGAGRGKRKAACGGGGRRGRKPKKAAKVTMVTAAPSATAAAQDVGDCRKHCDKEKSSSSPSSSSSGTSSVDSSPPPRPQQRQLATLPLMPVTAAEDKAAACPATVEPELVPSQVAAAARPLAPRAMRPAAAAAYLVTVEEVTATWRDGEAPASATGADEAPAFVSDQWGRVTWWNAAFVRAASADDGDEAAAPVVLGSALPAWGTCAGFTCRVRARHWSARRVGSPVVAPCDVWRLDAAGSYLWRLDLQAALTLGGCL